MFQVSSVELTGLCVTQCWDLGYKDRNIQMTVSLLKVLCLMAETEVQQKTTVHTPGWHSI
jgi:hypothetical protein